MYLKKLKRYDNGYYTEVYKTKIKFDIWIYFKL